MRLIAHSLVALVALVAVAACAGSTASPTGGAPQAVSPSAATGSGGTGAACADASGAGAVTVSIKNFAFNPGEAQAKVGDTVTWTNDDSAPHSAVLDDDSCGTETLSQGSSGALVFNAAGTYPYHCSVHPATMKGTVVVTP